MAIEINFQTPGDVMLKEVEAISGSVDQAINGFNNTLDGISTKVRSQDLTEKHAGIEKDKASAALGKSLMESINRIEGKNAELEAYAGKLSNPVPPEVEALQKAEHTIEKHVEFVLKKLKTFPDGSYEIPPREDANLIAMNLVRGELQALNSNLRKAEIRQAMLTTQGGIVTIPSANGGYEAKKLSADEWRLHVFRQVVNNGDHETIAVLTDPTYESVFFGSDTKTWAAFMQEKAKWQDSLITNEMKANRSQAQWLRDQSAKSRYMLAQRVSKLLETGKLTLDRDQFDKVSGLLNKKFNIGGKGFGTSWNPFYTRKMMRKE